jgi:hypothetical protein
MYNGTQMTQVGRGGNRRNGTEESRHKKKLKQKGKDVICIWHMAGGCKE